MKCPPIRRPLSSRLTRQDRPEGFMNRNDFAAHGIKVHEAGGLVGPPSDAEAAGSARSKLARRTTRVANSFDISYVLWRESDFPILQSPGVARRAPFDDREHLLGASRGLRRTRRNFPPSGPNCAAPGDRGLSLAWARACGSPPPEPPRPGSSPEQPADPAPDFQWRSGQSSSEHSNQAFDEDAERIGRSTSDASRRASSPRRSPQRAAAVHALANRTGRSPRTLYRWLDRYETHGVAGLARSRSAKLGAPPVLVSRAFDRACRAAGHDETVVKDIAETVTRH